ncbi:MAG: sugar ABC transporter permease [Spirochaetaceae bacterium]|nr:sugar ABC transporter permease [Spirochaetaceae bacterium]
MLKRNNANLFFIAPAFLLYSLVLIFPIALTIVFGFVKWERFNVISFGTLEHFARIATDPVLGKAFINNFIYIFLTIFLEGFVGLILAGIARRLTRSLGFRAVFFAPVILPSIVIGTLWRQMYATSGGLLNSLLELVGGEPLVWLAPPYTMISVSIVSGWIFAGYFMTIFYASMSRIPDSITDAARIDGAGPWTSFFRIEIPLIKNMIVLALLVITTGGFKGFDLFQILLRRDPLQSGIVLPTYLIRTFFEHQNIGYGSALSMLITAVVVVFMIVINFANKQFVGEVDEF